MTVQTTSEAPSFAQDTIIDRATCSAIIEDLAEKIRQYYVFHEVANEVSQELRCLIEKGAYDAINDAPALASALTEKLYQLTNDKHLRVRYLDRPAQGTAVTSSGSEEEGAIARMQSANFGFYKVERLPGNLGYIDLRNFHYVKYAANAITSAMTLIAYTDALIVDLRNNGGGDPNAVAFMTSYLFDQRTHLNDMYWRSGDRVDQFWTDQQVPGPRYGQDKDVYVLTSKRTFSAAEEFAYNLQNLKRATVVGDITGGGAHPCNTYQLQADLAALIPIGRAINPVSKANWEGTGVRPDVHVQEDAVFNISQRMALQKLLDSGNSAYPRDLQARLEELTSSLVAFN